MGKLNKKDMRVWFVFLSLLSVMTSVIALFVSHGDMWDDLFFKDYIDTGMDFFHSIEYTRGRAPYQLFQTLYPPLANLIFYILFRFVPLEQAINWSHTFEGGVVYRATAVDLRVHQSTLMLFILYLITVTVLTIVVIQKYFNNTELATTIGVLCIMSQGFIYGIERGNIILIAVLCSAFFVFYKDSENKIISELALIALAIAAGLKLYPALLGILLLLDKDFKRAIRAVIYGIIAFVAPCFIFIEGLDCIRIFLNVLFKFTKTEEIKTIGFSFDKICNSLTILFCELFHVELPEQFMLSVYPKLNIVASVILLVCTFFVKKYWKKVLCLCMGIIFFQDQGIYIIVFIMIPLLMMIKEEKIISRDNVVYFALMIATQLWLPIVDVKDAIISVQCFRIQIPLLILFIVIIVDAIKSLGKRNDICEETDEQEQQD